MLHEIYSLPRCQKPGRVASCAVKDFASGDLICSCLQNLKLWGLLQLRHKVDKLSQLPGVAIGMLRMEQTEGCSETIQAAVDGFGRQALRDIVAFSGSLAPKHMTSLLEGFTALWHVNAWSTVLPRSKASMCDPASAEICTFVNG